MICDQDCRADVCETSEDCPAFRRSATVIRLVPKRRDPDAWPLLAVAMWPIALVVVGWMVVEGCVWMFRR